MSILVVALALSGAVQMAAAECTPAAKAAEEAGLTRFAGILKHGPEEPQMGGVPKKPGKRGREDDNGMKQKGSPQVGKKPEMEAPGSGDRENVTIFAPTDEAFEGFERAVAEHAAEREAEHEDDHNHNHEHEHGHEERGYPGERRPRRGIPGEWGPRRRGAYGMGDEERGAYGMRGEEQGPRRGPWRGDEDDEERPMPGMMGGHWPMYGHAHGPPMPPAVILSHVVEGKYTAEDLLQGIVDADGDTYTLDTALGTTLLFSADDSDTVYVTFEAPEAPDGKVVEKDIEVCEGVMHIVSDVLLPAPDIVQDAIEQKLEEEKKVRGGEHKGGPGGEGYDEKNGGDGMRRPRPDHDVRGTAMPGPRGGDTGSGKGKDDEDEEKPIATKEPVDGDEEGGYGDGRGPGGAGRGRPGMAGSPAGPGTGDDGHDGEPGGGDNMGRRGGMHAHGERPKPTTDDDKPDHDE